MALFHHSVSDYMCFTVMRTPSIFGMKLHLVDLYQLVKIVAPGSKMTPTQGSLVLHSLISGKALTLKCQEKLHLKMSSVYVV